MEILKSQQLLPDVVLELYEKRLVIRSEIPLRTISSAVYCGGVQEDVRSILNLTVHKGYQCDDPAEDLRHEIAEMGLPEQTVGLMTAVDVKNAEVAFEQGTAPNDSGLRVAAVVTAGTGNAWRAGAWPTYLGETEPSVLNPYPFPPGTVNMIVLLDGTMTDAAVVNAAMTITEAKTAAFYDRSISCRASGKMATGTTTDAVVIACTGRGPLLHYGGPGTEVGALLARAVTRALNQALDTYDRDR